MFVVNPSNDDDRDILVQHEEQPDQLLDNEYTGGAITCSLPPEDDPYSNVDLQQTAALAPPPDRYNFVYLVFYLLGTATMTPWNFFITAEDYWMYKFRNTTLNESDIIPPPELTPMQKNFPCDLTVTASISGTTFLILNAIYGHHVSLRLKMLATLTVISLIFSVTTAFVEIDTDSWQTQFFYLTLGTVVIINISSATMSGGLFGLIGLFPSEYITAVVSGQALGGIFTALAFILALTFGASPKITAVAYFSIGNLVIVMSIVTYAIISRQAFFKFYAFGTSSIKYQISSSASTSSSTVGIIDVGLALEPNLRVVFGKIYMYATGICVLFGVTLSVYPAVTVLMQSVDYGKGHLWNDLYFLPVVNYLCFNSGDYLGRIIAGLIEKPKNNPQTVLLLTIVRVLFIPFFLMSNTTLHNFLPTLVHSDAAFITIMITFAMTNGYLANIIMIMAPRSVMHHEKEMASSIMAASLSVGLSLGAALSMGFVQLI